MLFVIVIFTMFSLPAVERALTRGIDLGSFQTLFRCYSHANLRVCVSESDGVCQTGVSIGLCSFALRQCDNLYSE